MHFVFILIGAFVGVAVGESSEELLGAVAGILIGSLLFRLAEAIKKIDRLSQRLNVLEQRQHQHTTQSTNPQQRATPAPVQTNEVPRAISQQETIVHPRVVEPVPKPGPALHAFDVAKRWMTTGNVPVKVGIVISFFGVAFLLKYAVEHSVLNIPISVRYLGVAVFAAVLLGLGWRMRSKQPAYALSLQGGGIGMLFLVVFAAFRLHDLLSPAFAFGLLVLITSAAGILAIRQESRALAILGTTGGFLAPLLVSTGSGNHVALFSYYLILNCAVLGVAWQRAWRELNVIGFVFTFGVGTIWGLQYYTPEKFSSTEPFLILHFVLYTAIAVLFAFRQRPKLRGYVDGSLVFGTPTIAFALQTQLLNNTEYGLAVSAAVVAVFYAALAYWLHQRREQNFELLKQSFIALGVGFATVAIPLALDDRWTAIAWALEGSALVWIGVKQSSTLARLTGAALAFAGGAIFVNFGWNDDLGLPLLNGNVLGGMLIAISSMFSARLLATDPNGDSWQRLASVGLLLWGLLWWLGTGTAEILDRGTSNLQLHLFAFFLTASFALFAAGGRRLQWFALTRATLMYLPLLLPTAALYLIEHDHFFDGYGVLVWVLAPVVHLWILHCGESKRGRTESLWHGAGAVLFVLVVAYELLWQIDKVALNDLWPASTGLMTIATGAWALMFVRDKIRWPFAAYSDAYYLAAVILTAGFLLMLTGICIDEPGDPAPLPYVPPANPLDILSVVGLYLLWNVIESIKEERWPIFLWGGSAFVLSTLGVVRAVHHIADVPWSSHAIMNSMTAQTSLTIFWAALGLTGMLLGTKRLNRRIWMLGGGLMIVVVLKMMVIDLSSTGTVARIVSFLGVGIMLLVVGYFSPVPPKPERAAA